MDDQNTVWQPIEPTTPVLKYPYEPTVHAPNPYEDAIPLPPPPPKKPRKFLGMVLVIAILLFSAAGLFAWTYTYHVSTTQPTPVVIVVTPTTLPTQQPTQRIATPQPTVNQNYTARDIMDDFQTAGIQPAYLSYGSTIWSWSGGVFYVGVHAKSSVTWTDDNGCNGPCEPSNLGLWVYSSPSVAETAYNDVKNDEYDLSSTTPTGPTIAGSWTSEYVHGRCLMLGSAGDMYTQVVDQHCV